MQMQRMLAWKVDLHSVVLSFLFVARQIECLLYAGHQKNLTEYQKRPLAPETLALSEAAEAGVLITAMLQESIRLPRLPEILCKIDNASLVETLKSSNLVSDWCLRIDVARVKKNDGKEGDPNWMDQRERTGCRLADKDRSLFWKFKRLVAGMSFSKIFFKKNCRFHKKRRAMLKSKLSNLTVVDT